MKTNTLIPFLCAADFFLNTHHVIIAAYFLKYLSGHTLIYIEIFPYFPSIFYLLIVLWTSQT